MNTNQDYPIFELAFQLKRSKGKVHVIYGIWAADLKPSGTLWIYTNAHDGAYYIENVRQIVSVASNKSKITISETEPETKKLIHLYYGKES